jgi:hypothetical protein
MPLVLGAAGAGGATTGGGQTKAYATINSTGGGGPIIFIGAIGDSGTVQNENGSGRVDPNGNFVRVSLSKGAFRLDITKLNHQADNAQPAIYRTSCSALLTTSGPATVSHGTGAYSGISGTLTVNLTVAFIGPRVTSGSKKGQCNFVTTARPVAARAFVTATGNVTFR